MRIRRKEVDTEISEDLRSLLKSILNSDFQNGTGRERIGNPVWTSQLIFTGKKLSGLMSAGVKSGLIGSNYQENSEDRTTWITEKGYDLIVGK
jgi:hypothetical protein